MARIGILTSIPSFHDNYGAILQGYALQRHLQLCGHDACDVLYSGGGEKLVQKKASPLARFKGIFLSGGSWSKKVGVITSKRGRVQKEARFLEFQKDHIRFSEGGYVDYEGIKGLLDSFDAFICGSDQVWNPRVHGGVNDPGYFLQFAVGRRRTIAYAPSMGVSELPDGCLANLKEYAGGIDFVSVREDSGAELLRRHAGVDALVVVDPTMLLDATEWSKVAARPDWLPDHYVAVYKFGDRGPFDGLVKRTAKGLGLPVVNIPAAIDPIFKTCYDVGPSEFIGIIAGADLVCTDSFHATVFSVLHGRKCVVFPRDAPGSTGSMNSRMTGLLGRIGMEGCYAEGADAWRASLGLDVDYDDVQARLSSWRSESSAFLDRALTGVNGG